MKRVAEWRPAHLSAFLKYLQHLPLSPHLPPWSPCSPWFNGLLDFLCQNPKAHPRELDVPLDFGVNQGKVRRAKDERTRIFFVLRSSLFVLCLDFSHNQLKNKWLWPRHEPPICRAALPLQKNQEKCASNGIGKRSTKGMVPTIQGNKGRASNPGKSAGWCLPFRYENPSFPCIVAKICLTETWYLFQNKGCRSLDRLERDHPSRRGQGRLVPSHSEFVSPAGSSLFAHMGYISMTTFCKFRWLTSLLTAGLFLVAAGPTRAQFPGQFQGGMGGMMMQAA